MGSHLLPKISIGERNHLYEWMCQLLHCITESTINAMCEELKVEYLDNPNVQQYIYEEGVA